MLRNGPHDASWLWHRAIHRSIICWKSISRARDFSHFGKARRVADSAVSGGEYVRSPKSVEGRRSQPRPHQNLRNGVNYGMRGGSRAEEDIPQIGRKCWSRSEASGANGRIDDEERSAEFSAVPSAKAPFVHGVKPRDTGNCTSE